MSPPLVIGDARHWRDRAEEARALARDAIDAKVKAAVLHVADCYDRLAERAAADQHQRSKLRRGSRC